MSSSTRLREFIRSNVMGIVACYIALGGTAYAIDGPLPGTDQVGSDDIINGEVASADVADNSVGTFDLHNNNVRSTDIRDDSFPGGGLGAQDLGPNSVGASEVDEAALDATVLQKRVGSSCAAGESIRAIAEDGTVTCEVDDSGSGGPPSGDAGGALAGTYPNPSLATDAVPANGTVLGDGSTKVAANAIDVSEIAPAAVASSEVRDGSLTGDDVENESLNGGEIANATLGPAKIIGDSLTANSLADGSVGAAEIQTNGVGWLEVATSTFDPEEIASIGSSFSIPNAAIDAGELGLNAVPADGTGNDGSTKLATDSVDFDEIAASAVRSVQVQDNSLGGSDIIESTLAPSQDAFAAASAGQVNLPGGGTFVGVAAENVPAGTYVVLARVEAYLGSDDDEVENVTCRVRSVGGAGILGSAVETLTEPGGVGVVRQTNFPILGWATLSSVDTLFLECSTFATDVHIPTARLVAFQVESVG